MSGGRTCTGAGAAAAILLIAAGLNGARAEDYPARTVTVIVPFAAGGPADITGRIVADIFSRYPRPRNSWWRMSAAPAAPLARCAPRRAPADGYTILSGHVGTNALAAGVLSEPRLRSAQRFRNRSASRPNIRNCWWCEKDFPANNLKEFVAYTRANEAKLNVGHARPRLGILYRLSAAPFGDRHQAGDGAVLPARRRC